MCGIVGVVGSERLNVSDAQMQRALDAVRHRGPDNGDIWCEGGVKLGHRRLSIVDLSPAGRQPMVSANDRYVLTYNGEMYNFRDMRRDLDERHPRAWRGHSDTEVLLEYIAAHGLEAALRRANGMFALGLWDRQERRLWLARDRFGEKPLYYVARGASFAFASELTALEQFRWFARTIDHDALAQYFLRGYFPAPLSIYSEVRKLPPASYLSWSEGQVPCVKSYWRLDDVIRNQTADRQRQLEPAAAVEELDGRLQNAVAERMIADVPLGVFLSGGLDSSLVAAAMQRAATKPITTFTLGFEDPALNEANYAREIAAHLKTNHIEETVTPVSAQAVVSKLGALYDEPLCDDSQVPTYLVSAMARKHVMVALSGDGGDELFGGYRRYRGTQALWRAVRKLPFPGAIGLALQAAPRPTLDVGLKFLKDFSARYGKGASVGSTLQRVAPWMQAQSLLDLYEFGLEKWHRDASPVRSLQNPTAWDVRNCPVSEALDTMCWHDQHNYLPGDILTKVDRASMAVGLETRLPFLDPSVVEFAWSLPTAFRTEKSILRDVLRRHVPVNLFDRPKAGFTPPIEAWLRGPLRDWANDLLSPARIARQGLLDVRAVTAFWQRYQRGGTLQDQRAWSVLMLQAWLQARGG
ncbi:MAG: asparagine synthase (glutamine-hydrolyzing) [Caulobacteraceae bacterium]